jgi:hypothetical protein
VDSKGNIFNNSLVCVFLSKTTNICTQEGVSTTLNIVLLVVFVLDSATYLCLFVPCERYGDCLSLLSPVMFTEQH